MDSLLLMVYFQSVDIDECANISTNVIGTRPSVIIRLEVTHAIYPAYPLPYNKMSGSDSEISIEI